MEKPSFKLVGAPCGQHGQYTFYKALRVCAKRERIIAIGDFFFIRLWQDSELVSVGELQLLWNDRASDQTLVSLRLYFLPENTPDGRGQHGLDEVLAINDKVVVRAEDLMSLVCDGIEWRWGLKAVWRGACAPPAELQHTSPLHHTKLDFSDVEREKSAISVDEDFPGVVVFSYPRYCRYRALLARLEGIQGDWLRDSLVAALGGYAAPSKNTRILYCKDTFEYPELEGHEFVCNHLAPKLKGRPRGRRKKRVRSRELSKSPSTDRSTDSERREEKEQEQDQAVDNMVQTERRLSLRNGRDTPIDVDAEEKKENNEYTAEDKVFFEQLEQFYKCREEDTKIDIHFNNVSLRSIYKDVTTTGGYEAVCRHKLWRILFNKHPARFRRHYERVLLPFENYERRNGTKTSSKLANGKIEVAPQTIDCIDITNYPTPEHETKQPENRINPEKVEKLEKPNAENENIANGANAENSNTTPSYPMTNTDNPALMPVNSLNEIENSVNKVESTIIKPEIPIASTESPLVKTEITTAKTEIPITESEISKAKAEIPITKTEIPIAKMEVTIAKTEDPVAKLETAIPETINTATKIEKIEPRSENILEGEKDEMIITSKPAEELNREFLESLPPKEEEKPLKITVKPVDKLIENRNISRIASYLENKDIIKLFQENSVLITELVAKHNLMDSRKVIDEIGRKQLSDNSTMFLSELAEKLNLANLDATFLPNMAKPELAGNTVVGGFSDKPPVNGHTPNGAPIPTEQKSGRPAGRSSLRAVRVKATRPLSTAHTPPVPLRADSSSSSPQPTQPLITNFGIHHPPQVTSTCQSDDEIVEVPYQPKTPEIIDLDEYPESPQVVKRKKLDLLKEGGLEVIPVPRPQWPHGIPPVIPPPLTPLIAPPPIILPAVQHQMITQQLYPFFNVIPNYPNGVQPPKVIQGTSIFGSSGPEKTVYGNPKDPFMPPPHVLHGTPVKPQRNIQASTPPTQDILDLTNKNESPQQKPAVEIVRIPTLASPSKTTPVQNSPKSYTIIDGKAVVGSNLEITLVNPKVTPQKTRPPQKRSSNGKFMSTKTPTPPKDYPRYTNPSPSGVSKKPQIIVPNYQISRENISPTSSTSSRDSQTNLVQNNMLQNAYKSQNSLAHLMEMQKSNVSGMNPFMDPYMSAIYSSFGQMDHRQMAFYREFMANQIRGYPGLLNLGVASTPTTKN